MYYEFFLCSNQLGRFLWGYPLMLNFKRIQHMIPLVIGVYYLLVVQINSPILQTGQSMTSSNNVWADEAPLYSQTRPAPPPVLTEILTQMIHTPRPALVVDLGSGTGLSTMIWSQCAERVIGIEPSDEMRSEANH